MNDAVARNRNKPKDPITTVPKRDVYIVLPYLGLQSKIITKRVKSCTYKVYGCINLKVIFRNTHRINSLFPYKKRLSRSLKSKVVYKASCWDCNDFYIGKTKRRLHDRKTEYFKALTKRNLVTRDCDPFWSGHTSVSRSLDKGNSGSGNEIVTKHLMTGPEGNSEFVSRESQCFPRRSRDSRETKFHCFPRDQSLSDLL